MKYLSYLIYILAYEILIIGGCGYAVFVLGHSGWWFLLAATLSSFSYSPSKWIHGFSDCELEDVVEESVDGIMNDNFRKEIEKIVNESITEVMKEFKSK